MKLSISKDALLTIMLKYSITAFWSITILCFLIFLSIIYILPLQNQPFLFFIYSGLIVMSFIIFFQGSAVNHWRYFWLQKYLKSQGKNYPERDFYYRFYNFWSFLIPRIVNRLGQEGYVDLINRIQQWKDLEDELKFNSVNILKDDELKVLTGVVNQFKLLNSDALDSISIDHETTNLNSNSTLEKEQFKINEPQTKPLLLVNADEVDEKLDRLFDFFNKENFLTLNDANRTALNKEDFISLLDNSQRLDVFVTNTSNFTAFLEGLRDISIFNNKYKTPLLKSHNFFIKNGGTITPAKPSYFDNAYSDLSESIKSEFKKKIEEIFK